MPDQLQRHYSDTMAFAPRNPSSLGPGRQAVRGTMSLPTSPILTARQMEPIRADQPHSAQPFFPELNDETKHDMPWQPQTFSSAETFPLTLEDFSASGTPPSASAYSISQPDHPLDIDLGAGERRESADDDVSGVGPVRRKRAQVRIACTHCQKACKKCSNTRPCERCVKYGLKDCVDSTRKPRKSGIKRGPYKRRSSKHNDPYYPPSPQLPSYLQSRPPPLSFDHPMAAGNGHISPSSIQVSYQNQRRARPYHTQRLEQASAPTHTRAQPHAYSWDLTQARAQGRDVQDTYGAGAHHPGKIPPNYLSHISNLQQAHPTRHVLSPSLTSTYHPGAYEIDRADNGDRIPDGFSASHFGDPQDDQGIPGTVQREGVPPGPRTAALHGAFALASKGPRWVHGQRTHDTDVNQMLRTSAGGIASFPMTLGGGQDPFSRAVSPIRGDLDEALKGLHAGSMMGMGDSRFSSDGYKSGDGLPGLHGLQRSDGAKGLDEMGNLDRVADTNTLNRPLGYGDFASTGIPRPQSTQVTQHQPDPLRSAETDLAFDQDPSRRQQQDHGGISFTDPFASSPTAESSNSLPPPYPPAQTHAFSAPTSPSAGHTQPSLAASQMGLFRSLSAEVRSFEGRDRPHPLSILTDAYPHTLPPTQQPQAAQDMQDARHAQGTQHTQDLQEYNPCSPAVIALQKIRKPSLRTLMSRGGSLAGSRQVSPVSTHNGLDLGQNSIGLDLVDGLGSGMQSPTLFDEAMSLDEF